jgi:hypothetical protein
MFFLSVVSVSVLEDILSIRKESRAIQTLGPNVLSLLEVVLVHVAAKPVKTASVDVAKWTNRCFGRWNDDVRLVLLVLQGLLSQEGFGEAGTIEGNQFATHINRAVKVKKEHLKKNFVRKRQ